MLFRTFVIGLAAVWCVGGLNIAWRDKRVDLPTASEDVLYVFPETDRFNCRNCNGGSGAGSTGGFAERTDDVSDSTKAAVIEMILLRFPHDTSANDDGKLFLEVPDSIIERLPKKIDGHRVSNGSELMPNPQSNFIYFQNWKQAGRVVSVTASDSDIGGCNYRFRWTKDSRKLLSVTCFGEASGSDYGEFSSLN
jgi:hypothetical protein